jgi:hypothetical protein
MNVRRVKTLVIAGLAAIGGLAALGAWQIGLVDATHDTGYFAPVFAPDGASILTIKRDARAIVTGPGLEFFTPPATVRLRQDRFELLRIRVSDGQTSVLETFPPSPLENATIKAYHGAIFGVAHAHLRWADATHFDYEIAVTRHDSPLSRTFVVRKVWNPATATYAAISPWQETSTGMAGDESQQVHGDLEAIAVPGNELMPCAIALLGRDGAARVLVETSSCRRKYPAGISSAVLAPISRRADIERSEKIRTTYADLVARGRLAGRSEGQAMLDAGKEMQRLGFYPKTPMLVAAPAGCDGVSPLFAISDAEFSYGLFPDIESAIAKPGAQIDKSMGSYITHRDFTTSRQINEYLDAGNASFLVRARGGCWRMTIQRP